MTKVLVLSSLFHPSYILWFYYTTDGITSTLSRIKMVPQAFLCFKIYAIKNQEPSVGIRIDLRLPVAAVATSMAEITAIISEVASAEEGEILNNKTQTP